MDEEAREKLYRYTFLVALLKIQVDALMMELALSYCGVRWDEDSGTFRKVMEGN